MQCSPFIKQCFVVLGISLNLAQFGLVIGFSALLLPQLRKPESDIFIDDATGSWIAAMPSLALLIGNITIPALMGKIGRKFANLISIIIVIVGWICIVLAPNVPALLAARFLQGISLGMSISLSPISIAEYTSPRWRGAFLTSLSLIMSLGTLFIHTITSFMAWKLAALVCTGITFLDLFIVGFSPESPSWLANQGRYDDCRRVFRWIRGDREDEELNRLIDASKTLKNNHLNDRDAVQMNAIWFVNIVKKKEFHQPIIIAVHMYFIGAICGINILSAYTVDVLNKVTNSEINIPLVVISIDIQRLITNSVAVYIIMKLKRRTVLFWSGFLNIIAFFLVSTYVYMRSKSMLPFDNSLVGVLLIHFHIFSASIGTFPVPLIICGELFSLKYRSISGGITAVFLSFYFFSLMKTFPFLTNSIGLSGSFSLYGALLCYCIVFAWFFLPETKDKTLQDIEDEFQGRNLRGDLQSVKSLMLPKQ